MSGGTVDRERTRRLMMAALDGEISGEDRRELEQMLERDAELQEEWQRMTRLKEVTSSMSFREPPEEVWEEYWTSIYNRIERGIAWLLASIGAIVLLGYGAWRWVEAILGDQDLPVYVKLAIFGVALGLVILAVSMIREKLFTRKRDPYKEVQR